MRTWGGATTTPRDLNTPSLNIGAGSFSRDRRNIAQYFSGARGRSRKGRCLWRSRTVIWPTMSFCNARESCCRFFACTIKSYSRHCAHSHSPSWNTTARSAYFLAARGLLPTLTTLSLCMVPAQSDAARPIGSCRQAMARLYAVGSADVNVPAKIQPSPELKDPRGSPRWRWRVTLDSRRLSYAGGRGSSLSTNHAAGGLE